jgi:transcriptional regulator of aromatic amino acid metabolism
MALLTPDDRKELDFEKLGPVLESLVNSDRVSAEERRAIELCARAAADLCSMHHEHTTKEFYSRPDVQRIESELIDRWLKANQGALAGTPVLIHGRWYVSSYTAIGDLQLTPIGPPWPEIPDAPG